MWMESYSVTSSLKPCAPLAIVLALFSLSTFYDPASAAVIQLQHGTATFSQGPFGGGPYTPEMAIDGSFFPGDRGSGTGNGWAIDHFPGDFSTKETAIWQTVPDVGPSLLTFTMYFLHWNPGVQRQLETAPGVN